MQYIHSVGFIQPVFIISMGLLMLENSAETVRSTVFFDTADMKKTGYFYHKKNRPITYVIFFCKVMCWFTRLIRKSV